MATINENVYGAKSNWIAPFEHIEFGTIQYADVYYYNNIAEDDNLKIKIANYNTVESPVTTMRSQINGQYPSENYLIKNNWNVTEFTMDTSIVQFGIGSQSGLSNQEYWCVDRPYNASDPTSTDPPTLKNSDTYDITNMCLATRSSYAPYEFTTFGQGSILTPYENGFMYWQGIVGQTFNTPDSVFGDWYNTQYGYPTGYMYTKLVTQIPIKNIKITPVIYAYNSTLDNYKKFTSISDYTVEKSAYPYIYCIKAQFKYRTGYDDTVKYDATFDCYPWIFNSSSFLKGYGFRFNNQDGVYGDNIYYPNRGDQQTGEGITVAGRPGYGHGPNGAMMGNEIYWCGHNNSSTANNFTIGQGGRVLQTPDFKFVLGAKNLFYCDVSAMSDNDITKGIRKQLASFGLFFVDGINDINLPLDDDKTFLGLLTDGVAYGNYTNGADNRNQPQWGWDTMEQNSYDPSNPPAQDRSSDPVTFNPVTLADGGLKRYVLDDNAMSAFGVDLYRIIDTSNPDELIQNQTLTNFLTNNPLDAVVSVKRFPLPDMSQGTLTNIMLGKVQMQTAAKPFASTATILSCGAVNIPAKFGNFLDYETQYELILPFCGTISLDPKIVTGKNVEVKYSIDYTTGTCTAWILTVTSDGIETVIDSANGNCTIDIPLSGVQTATLTGEIYNANENLKTVKFNAVVNAVSGIGDFAKDVKSRDVAGGAKTVANAVNSIHDIKKAEWNINNTQIPFKMIGASSGCNAFQIELIPRLNVYYPIVDSTYNAADYRHNVGAAVCDTTTIGDYSGYAEITNVDLSGFAATAEEKNMIANALMGGVYL